MIRRIAAVVALCAVLLGNGACVPRAPGAAAPSRRPTVGPVLPHQPGYRKVKLTVMVRDRDQNQIRGRLYVVVDAVAAGDRGNPARGQRLPLDREVDSGWTFPLEIDPEYRVPITFTLDAVTIGTPPRGTILTGAIYLDDAVVAYLAECLDRIYPGEGTRPLHVHCSGILHPLSGGG